MGDIKVRPPTGGVSYSGGAVAGRLPVSQQRGWEGAQQVVDQLADRTDPIEVDDVEEMIHTITNNITTKKQRTK